MQNEQENSGGGVGRRGLGWTEDKIDSDWSWILTFEVNYEDGTRLLSILKALCRKMPWNSTVSAILNQN